MCNNSEYKNVCEISKLKVDAARHELKIKTRDITINSMAGRIEHLNKDLCDLSSENDANLLKLDVLTQEIARLKPKSSYITPDDEIAKDRPTAKFSDDGRSWTASMMLVFVRDDGWFMSDNGELYRYCRMLVED